MSDVERIPYGGETRANFAQTGLPCHDCRTPVGQLHTAGCDVEECVGCHGQRISCQCCTACHQREGDYLICAVCLVGREQAGAEPPEDAVRWLAGILAEIWPLSDPPSHAVAEIHAAARWLLRHGVGRLPYVAAERAPQAGTV